MSARDKLREYGGRIVHIDNAVVVELVNHNDNARHRYQYRRSGNSLEARLLAHDGSIVSEWERRTDAELLALRSQRGKYHPILDPLGL
jgi:hypothetical protein